MEDESSPDGKPRASDSRDTSRESARNGGDGQDTEPAHDGALNVAPEDVPLSKISATTQKHSNGEAILLPDDSSILFGRGKSCNNHPGNIKMRLLLNRYREEYQKSVRGEKSKLVQRVYNELKDSGMTFLKPTDGQDGWEEVPHEAAIQKVGHALRNNRTGSHPKSPRIRESLVAEDGGTPKADTKPLAHAESTVASVGSLQQQVARIQGLSNLSLPLGTDLVQGNNGLAQGSATALVQRAAELIQQSSTAAPILTLREQLAQSALSRLLGTGLPRGGDLIGGGDLVQHSSSSAAVIRAAQEQLAASQRSSALSLPLGTGLQGVNSLLPGGMLGNGVNSALDPLFALEQHRRREVEMQRLLAALLPPALPAALPDSVPALSADQLYAIAERESQLRRGDELLQVLLRCQQARDSGPSSEQAEGGNQNGEHH